MGITLCQCKGSDQQMFEIMFDLKRFSPGRMRKRRRIENDRIESFASSSEPGQHGSDVIGYESMVHS